MAEAPIWVSGRFRQLMVEAGAAVAVAGVVVATNTCPAMTAMTNTATLAAMEALSSVRRLLMTFPREAVCHPHVIGRATITSVGSVNVRRRQSDDCIRPGGGA